MKKYIIILAIFLANIAMGQSYWQQKVSYTMDINFDDNKHQFKGTQKIVYTNNSPDELDKVFYHLYFNAFQQGSMMDVRSRTIKDPDKRVGDRISNLKTEETGYQKINSLKMNGQKLDYKIVGTILEVKLPKPIAPNTSVTFEMDFEAQVPIQIRRSGRNSKEGIDYSMTQWYPKMSEYDREGWHANPYVGREFHGVWGDFDVTIHMNKKYTIGGTGVLQNPEEIGKGYLEIETEPKVDSVGKLSWHFKAENVHDFAWAADPDYKHDIKTLDNGTKMHFFYQTDTLVENWEKCQSYAVKTFEYVNKNYGEYPYSDYSIIQGGDGGMEYPMATLITAHGSFGGLVSVIVHESLHSWYQGMMATDESKYPWMDEGFTSYVQHEAMDFIYGNKKINSHSRSHGNYQYLVKKDLQEPLTTHADHYKLNMTYGISVYSKGEVFLDQLSYIIGREAFMTGMKEYYNQWRFKHPTPSDFKKVMEQASGIELDWYLEQFIGTTNFIDYSIENISKCDKNSTSIELKKIGDMPMPLDVVVTLKDGTKKVYNIPLRIMRGAKQKSQYSDFKVVNEDWPWTNPTFTLCIDVKQKEIESVEIDPTLRLSDIDRSNNIFPRKEEIKE
ncbi:M1 family metallopeptidase [Flavobacteriales bacterium]|nr:M1 family metallopeptidase [Flavobacteriales bacterium]